MIGESTIIYEREKKKVFDNAAFLFPKKKKFWNVVGRRPYCAPFISVCNVDNLFFDRYILGSFYFA